MILNNIKIAWRNLKNKKFYTTIHLVGLFTGICFAIMISAFVWQEFQVNRNLRNSEQQYILTSKWKDPSMGIDFTTLAPIAQQLKEQYPHLVANYYRWDGITSIVSNGTTNFRKGILLGDETLLDIFGFEMLYGNAKTVFENPFSVVITEARAIKFFGKTDVVGNTLAIQNFEGEDHDFLITGVLKDIPENSINQINATADNDFFIAKNSATYFDRENFEDWNNPYYVSYVELQKGVEASDLALPLETLIKMHTSEEVQQNLTVLPVKLTDYYLEKDNAAAGRMLYILSFIGLFMLLMAMINFINISISHSGKRMREIGIRKVLGGNRKQLIIQFLTESIILVAFATLLACISYSFLRPWFGKLLGKDLIAFSEMPYAFAIIPFILIVILGFLAGFYPALVISSFKSIDAIQGKLKNSLSNTILRKVLVGFQYVTALVVLIIAIIVAQQINYFFGKGLGYDKEYIVTASLPRDWTPDGVQKMITVRDAFEKIPAVKKVSLSYVIPDGGIGFQVTGYKSGANPNAPVTAQGLVTDDSFIETYQIPLLAGTYLSKGDTSPDEVVINLKAVQSYGFESAEDAVGQQITLVGEDAPLNIHGVIDDFHFESMHQPIKPQVIFSVDDSPIYRYLSFKLNSGSINESIKDIEKQWGILLPGSSFEYKFMDDTLASLYATEIQFKRAANVATLLALLIALLGVFGMVALSIDKRVKEIGIRKVLGASIASIGVLFVKEFFIILLVAIVIACPLGYWLMNGWLQNYTYQTTIGIDPFIIAILLVGGITVGLILLQTLKIARANPVKSLRNE